MSAPGLPDLEALEDAERDKRKRYTATLIVATTLVTALVGYLQSDASRAATDAAVESRRHGIAAMGQLLRGQDAANVEYETYVLAQEQRRQEANALQAFLLADGASTTETSERLEQEMWSHLARTTAELTSIRHDSPDGPGSDPAFPSRFYARQAQGAYRLAAEQDAAAELAAGWGDRAGRYTAILTMFAVALYLLGSSLAMRRGAAIFLAGSGAVVAAVAAGWTSSVAIDRPSPAPREAAAAFAEGIVSQLSAYDQATYREAEAHFTRAIELRPTFARAYVERATVTFIAGSPQEPGVAASITTPEALRRAISDLRTASDLGIENATTLGGLGFFSFLLAVQEDDPDAMRASIEYSERSIERDPEDPIAYFNLGAALLASGQTEAARAAYTDAVMRALYVDLEAEELRGNPFQLEFWLAGALTDLEIVSLHLGAEFAAEVRATKEFLVGSLARATGELGVADVTATLDTATATVFPSKVQFETDFTDVENDDLLSVQWYHEAPNGLGWSVLPAVSGTMAPHEERVGIRSFLAGTFPPSCLPPGRYRAEFYVDGHLVKEAETEATFGPLVGSAARQVNVGFCHPEAWTVSESTLPGLIEGFVAPAGDRGTFIIRFEEPGGSALGASERARFYLDSLDEFRYLLPEGIGALTDNGLNSGAGNYFLGLAGGETRDFSYAGGQMVAGAGVTNEGAVLIAFVYGPDTWFGIEEPYRIYDSLGVLAA